jgi:hypothetical protein
MTDSNHPILTALLDNLRFKKLTIEQIEQIDELLESAGEYGEVHLIIQHGKLKYINLLESHSARKPVDGKGSTKI